MGVSALKDRLDDLERQAAPASQAPSAPAGLSMDDFDARLNQRVEQEVRAALDRFFANGGHEHGVAFHASEPFRMSTRPS
jgi:hypothetical protein